MELGGNQNLSPKQVAQLKSLELKLNQDKLKLIEGLPHRFQWKWYTWARQFYESKNKLILLTAANQTSKSSTQIRKCIELATNKALWPTLWRTRPQQFWYLYPTKDLATTEFEKKWVTEFLPRGDFKTHPDYGWRAEYSGGRIYALHFNTGITVYFKTYAQDVTGLQASSAHAIFCDEELPVEIFPELQFRLAATDGYFSMVFTATLNQDFWRRAIERVGFADEVFPQAFKQQITMFDCLYYEDGTLGAFTEERIKQIIAMCPNENEVQRRVFGKFVKNEGRLVPSFMPNKHVIKPITLGSDYKVYSGVDIGSGGKAHPADCVRGGR
jgi:hypothetical protein